jgi:RHS repeat-associated protein
MTNRSGGYVIEEQEKSKLMNGAGSTKVAMRTGSSTINYLLGDHLGSNAITTDSSGVKSAEIRYYPWGTTRYTSGTGPTSFQYTGQRVEGEMGGLVVDRHGRVAPELDMASRASFISSFAGNFLHQTRPYKKQCALGRFMQPDTIVPGGVQGLDRYAYVGNNPMKYVDPSGNGPESWDCGPDGWWCIPGRVGPNNLGIVDPLRKFLDQIYNPIHDPSQNYPHGFLQLRGSDYSVGNEGDINHQHSNSPYYHPGVDIGDILGTPVYPIYPGVVVYTGWNYDLGNTIILEHNVDGKLFYSVYGHLGTNQDDSGILVTEGDSVSYNDQIGTMGNTKGGGVTDTHLHLEIRTELNVNINSYQNNNEYVFGGTQWWVFTPGATTWYRLFPNWRSAWVDLGLIYGYDTSADPSLLTVDNVHNP